MPATTFAMPATTLAMSATAVSAATATMIMSTVAATATTATATAMAAATAPTMAAAAERAEQRLKYLLSVGSVVVCAARQPGSIEVVGEVGRRRRRPARLVALIVLFAGHERTVLAAVLVAEAEGGAGVLAPVRPVVPEQRRAAAHEYQRCLPWCEQRRPPLGILACLRVKRTRRGGESRVATLARARLTVCGQKLAASVAKQ